MRCERRRGFTLVELLVVIGILAVLMGILLPALGKAREAGNTIKCSANMRSIGQAMSTYLADNKSGYPAAYLYRPTPNWAKGSDRFPQPSNGYIHWSSYIFGNKAGRITATAFQCPSLDNGGLPPTNPADADRESGQVNDPVFAGAEPDSQVPRCAYTPNEAIMPRNKFDATIRGASQFPQLHYKYVKFSAVKRATDTILMTEFWSDWKIVSEVASGADPVVKSHRPVSGYYPILGSGTDLVAGVTPTSFVTHARVTSVTNPVNPNNGVSNTLGWVGRNHGPNKHGSKGESLRKTNFLYVDGHVETKTIEETLKPIFQWGELESIYSLPGVLVAK